jgi:RNA polymerase sigma factor (sigma-70 family)
MTEMINFVKLRQAAMATGSYHGMKDEEAEDFAQFALEKIFQRGSGRLKLLWIDYLRETYGDPRKNKESANAQRLERTQYAELNPDDAPEENPFHSEVDFFKLLETLDSEEKTILVLRHKWDFSYPEIAECFGVNQSRIAQRIKEIEKKLCKRMTKITEEQIIAAKE